MIEVGMKGHEEVMVTPENTAAAMVSGTLPVFATPCMISLMEATAWKSISAEVEEGWSTVGTSLDVKHLSATPIGMKVWCDSELIEVDRKRMVFKLEVFDEAGKIGEGIHERFLVQNDKFLARAEAKKAQ